jgi:hypothetical protein
MVGAWKVVAGVAADHVLLSSDVHACAAAEEADTKSTDSSAGRGV